MNLLLLAASLSFAAPTTKYLGDGALRLIPQALAQARQRWGDDICLSGVHLLVGREVKAFGPGARPGRITTFQFEFLSRETGSRYQTFFTEAEGPAPYDPAGSVCRLDTFYEFRPGSLHSDCIAGFSIDSDDALGIATRHGIDLARWPSPVLSIQMAGPGTSLGKRVKAVRGKTVWIVVDGKDWDRSSRGTPRYHVFIDAKTGRVLEKGLNSSKAVGNVGAVEQRYPGVSVDRNLCSEDSGF